MTQSAEHKHLAPPKPVSAIHHERVARSAFEICEGQVDNLKRLVELSATMIRSPAVTFRKRQSQHVLLGLLVDTAETYLREAEGSREMFRIIAFDASGVPDATVSAESAARLLTPTRKAKTDSRGTRDTPKAVGRKAVPATRVKTSEAVQAVAAQH
jgi:hypothetical protein